MTSLPGLVIGQYFSRPVVRPMPSSVCFSTYILTQFWSYVLNVLKFLTLWRGISTLLKRVTCSYFKGTDRPYVIDWRISSNSVIPL